ncbi:hypothetical protein [Curtobacterium ammoniigenes]|uniref:hypothetical protein n=1 Tax=Curtobacterium ammoniigenes TaxID=395387 RepID=UPI000A7B0576|nr:hypothetical protein [Curtobacterium ammoniigenes]
MQHERTRGRERAPRVAMALDEAQRIAEHAASGLLDTTDADVARVVAQANRVVMRAQMWGASEGATTRRWRRMTVIGGLVFIAVWVAGLLVPLALSVR